MGALDRTGHVISLAAFRAARIGADFMLGTFHDPPWMAGVVVEGDGYGGAVLVVLLRWETEMIRRCLPTKVNGVPVMARKSS
jgi:hypothetical protein